MDLSIESGTSKLIMVNILNTWRDGSINATRNRSCHCIANILAKNGGVT